MCTLSLSKGPGQGGNPCQETGVKIGKVTPTSTVNPSLSKSLPVMAGRPLLTTLLRPVGNSVKPLKVANSSSYIYIYI